MSPPRLYLLVRDDPLCQYLFCPASNDVSAHRLHTCLIHLIIRVVCALGISAEWRPDMGACQAFILYCWSIICWLFSFIESLAYYVTKNALKFCGFCLFSILISVATTHHYMFVVWWSSVCTGIATDRHLGNRDDPTLFILATV